MGKDSAALNIGVDLRANGRQYFCTFVANPGHVVQRMNQINEAVSMGFRQLVQNRAMEDYNVRALRSLRDKSW